MRISEKLMAKYKNMNLTRKMLLVYFAFAGVFLIVSVSAFQISMEAFEKRLYENSLHELTRDLVFWLMWKPEAVKWQQTAIYRIRPYIWQR